MVLSQLLAYTFLFRDQHGRAVDENLYVFRASPSVLWIVLYCTLKMI